LLALAIVFDYHISRAGAHAPTFLQDWRGHLMVDDYAGYKALFAAGGDRACMPGARPAKVLRVHATSGSPVAEEASRRIGQLYAIEQQASGLTPEQRLALREQHAIPALAAMHSWLLTTQCSVAAGRGTAKAIEHTLKRWPALQRYATSGSLPIDNNPLKNAIRPTAIGKKIWLFAGSERVGRRAAAIQGLFATDKLNGLDPVRWLADTLEKLSTCPNSRIDLLGGFKYRSQTLYTGLKTTEGGAAGHLNDNAFTESS